MRRGVRLTAIVAIAVLTAVAGCSGPAASPSPSAVVSPVPTASPAATLAPDIAYAIHQREQFGLRADLEWVLAVAADPRARIQMLDFPMLPDEEAALTLREADFDAVVAAVNDYAAAHADEFGGLYIDQASHSVVALWTSEPEVHRLAILHQLGRFGPLQVRLVRYTERALRDLQDRISADWDWMVTIQARATGVGADVMANVVELSISSANPLATALIVAHYGLPVGMLRVDSDGTGILLVKRGMIHGTVVTADGKAPGPNTLTVSWAPDNPGAGAGDCGGGDIGYGVGNLGQFDLPCPPGGWTITIGDSSGSGHVVVPAGGEVTLRITLDAGTVLFNP